MPSPLSLSRFVNRMIYLRRSFGKRSFRLLDVGAGNHSASKTLKVFPGCEYYGLDLDRSYNNSPEDFELMKDFFELDLTLLDYDVLPDNFFDGIWMVHVIEHLHNGEDVLKALLPKLKTGGYMYIEYPGKRSLGLPSMYGTLNFHDDPTHVKVYDHRALGELLRSKGCKVLSGGTRRNIWFMAAMPFRLIGSLLKRKKINANIFWDVTGFAEYLWVRKDVGS